MLLSSRLSNHVYYEIEVCDLDKRIHIPREPFNSTFHAVDLSALDFNFNIVNNRGGRGSIQSILDVLSCCIG